MRADDNELNDAQKLGKGFVPLVKVALTGATPATYYLTTALNGEHTEEIYNHKLIVELDNSDGALSDLNYKGYQCDVYFGGTVSETDYYSKAAPQWVVANRWDSAINMKRLFLTCVGLPNLLVEDKAEHTFTPLSTSTDTIKTLFAAIAAGTTPMYAAWQANTAYVVGDKVRPVSGISYAYKCTTAGTTHASNEPEWTSTIGATFADGTVTWTCVHFDNPFSDCSAIAVEWDSEDSLIDAYIPKDSFRIFKGSSRLSILRRLIDYTKCIMRFENDGKIHIRVPVTTGEVYDYEYSLTVDGEHPFFSKAYRENIVIPNKIVVSSLEDDSPFYVGSATSAASFALLPKIQYEETYLASNAQGTGIAEAMIAKYEMSAETGSVYVKIMNTMQELYDYILVTDARQGDARAGNVGSIVRRWNVEEVPFRFDMTISFGGWLGARQDINNMELYPSGFGSQGQFFARLTVKDLYATNITADNIDMVWLDPDGTVDLSQIGDDLDRLADGSTYARIKSLHLDAGVLRLDEAVTYSDDFDPRDKFDLGDDTFDNIPEGVRYNRVLATHISAGKILLTDDTQVSNFSLDQVPDGSSYQRAASASLDASGLILLDQVVTGTYSYVRATELSAGYIKLTTDQDLSGQGFDIVSNATTTRITITSTAITGYNSGVAQFYLQASDGKAYAGAGAVMLDASGITVKGQDLIFQHTDATVSGYVYGASDVLVVLGDADVFIGNSANGGIDLYAGSLSGSVTANSIQMRAVDRVTIGAGTADPSGETTSITLYAESDVYLFADTNVYLAPTGESAITRMKTDNDARAYSLDTGYENTGLCPVLVVISVDVPDAEGVELRIGSSDPAGTTVSKVYNNAGGSGQTMVLVAIVPVGMFYKAVDLSGGCSVVTWHEYGLGQTATTAAA